MTKLAEFISEVSEGLGHIKVNYLSNLTNYKFKPILEFQVFGLYMVPVKLLEEQNSNVDYFDVCYHFIYFGILGTNLESQDF